MTHDPEQHAISCPHCRATLRISEEILQTRLKCRFCGTIFLGQSETAQDNAPPARQDTAWRPPMPTEQESQSKPADPAPPTSQPTRIAARAAAGVSADDIPTEWTQADIAPHEQRPVEFGEAEQPSPAHSNPTPPVTTNVNHAPRIEQRPAPPAECSATTKRPPCNVEQNPSGNLEEDRAVGHTPDSPASEALPCQASRAQSTPSGRRTAWIIAAAILLMALGGILLLLWHPWKNSEKPRLIPKGALAPPHLPFERAVAPDSRPTHPTKV